jgi:phosphoribosylformylglycinamidine synthase subunit PurSL
LSIKKITANLMQYKNQKKVVVLMINLVRVQTIAGTDLHGERIHEEVKRTLGITTITKIETVKIYRLQGLSLEETDHFAQTVLVDSLNQKYSINSPLKTVATKKVEIGKKPGVMNPEVGTIFTAATHLNLHKLVAIDTSWEYHFFGDLTEEQLDHICTQLLSNKTIDQVIIREPKSLLIKSQRGTAHTIALRSLSEEALLAYAHAHHLYLDLQELAAIQNYFCTLGRDPYDVEFETIAQTWSEHCYHKTFKADIVVNGIPKKPLFTRLKETANLYSDNVISAFVDNAGVFRFYDNQAIVGKVETHNSPSAIEPYGGAATGCGGVFRDIMGTGKGAAVIASTNMLCFAPPNLPDDQIPPGCLSPDYLLRNVVAGIRDYGNRMGIPTNNGSIHFHEDFRAKPAVIVGAYGIAPEHTCKKYVPCVGDIIVLVGGRTGRDGIHGATFSSSSMTATTLDIHANAVQIGNAIEEKRVTDALIAARNDGLIRTLTDCGAGGLSSAIGEMAATLGAYVELEKVPLKYTGLNPWEIWISESQERMVCAIAPEHIQKFKTLCDEYNVETAVVGAFTGDQQLLITYNQEIVCNLNMHFLHDGIPKKTLSAFYQQPDYRECPEIIPLPTDWEMIYCSILSQGNICSKEPIVRQYDHGVQGTNALPPFTGIAHDGPNDAAVLVPLLGKPYGLIISHGMNPELTSIDPYWGSWWAITEALANLVAVGGNYKDTCLIDNFIWPYPDAYFLGKLDAALEACVDAMNLFKIPFISGKDSLSNSYQHPDGYAIHIPPTLCISAFGKISDVRATVSADFKQSESLIVLIGDLDMSALGGSVYASLSSHASHSYRIPHVRREKLPLLFSTVHELINHTIVRACHDISEGGVAVSLAEMCFGNEIGASLDLSFLGTTNADLFLFNETAGCFLIEIAPHHIHHALFAEIPNRVIGTTTTAATISACQNNRSVFEIPISTLKKAWKQPMKKVFRS